MNRSAIILLVLLGCVGSACKKETIPAPNPRLQWQGRWCCASTHRNGYTTPATYTYDCLRVVTVLDSQRQQDDSWHFTMTFSQADSPFHRIAGLGFESGSVDRLQSYTGSSTAFFWKDSLSMTLSEGNAPLRAEYLCGRDDFGVSICD